MNSRELYNHNVWTETIEKVYGFKSYQFSSKDNSSLTLTHVRSKFMKNILVSGAFVSHNNPVINSQAGLDEILDQAIQFSKDKNCDYVELRTSNPLPIDWELIDDHVTFRIDLSQGSEYVFQRIKRKVRGAIRRGQKNNLYFKADPSLVKEFYDIYSISVQRLGTPVHSFNFFSELIRGCDDFNVMVVYTPDHIPISAVLFAQDRDTIYPLAGGGLSEYNHFSADSFKYWSLLETACEKGLSFFDYGRSSKNTGTFDFKKRWFAQETQLYYYYYFNSKKKPVTKQSLSYKLFSNTWKKLPISATRILGPFFRKSIP